MWSDKEMLFVYGDIRRQNSVGNKSCKLYHWIIDNVTTVTLIN